MVSSESVKAFVFILLVGSVIALWLYTQRIINHVRKFQNEVVNTQVQIYLSIIDPQFGFDTGIPTQLLDAVIMDAPYPFIITNEDHEPIQGWWHNIDIAVDDSSRTAHQKLKKIIRKMDKINPSKTVLRQALDSRTDTLTVYEMPTNRNYPVVITDESGNSLYRRNINSDISDTLTFNYMITKLDSYTHPVRFEEEGEPSLIFHGIKSLQRWPIIVVKNKKDLLYCRGFGVSVNDTTVAAAERIEAVKESIRKRGMVYDIVANYDVRVNDTLLFHYGDLPFITLIAWLPVIELTVLLILISIGIIGLIIIKNAEQRSIWVGMAKETAHQLGTPISSLRGWLELLKAEPEKEMLEQALPDIEYDVKRLTRVADRFSNVGSKPELKPISLPDVVDEVIDYFSARVPHMGKSVVLEAHYDELRTVMGNHELLNWAFENMIKNSISAIEAKEGRISVSGAMSKDFRKVILDFKDNGRGIASTDQKKVMKPGYTTRKRGWGLGLSLVKRIIEDYHGGKFYLLESRPGEGSTFRVILPAIKIEGSR